MKTIYFVAAFLLLTITACDGPGGKALDRAKMIADLEQEIKQTNEKILQDKKSRAEKRSEFFKENGPFIKVLAIYGGSGPFTIVGESESTKNRIVVPYYRPESIVGDTWFPMVGDVVEVELKRDGSAVYFTIAGPKKDK